MTTLLTWLDRTAVTLTGVGVMGGALAAIDILPAPWGVASVVAFGAGVASCVVVKLFAPKIERTSVEAEPFHEMFDDLDECLQVKAPLSDPGDPTVPGSPAWNAWMNPPRL